MHSVLVWVGTGVVGTRGTVQVRKPEVLGRTEWPGGIGLPGSTGRCTTSTVGQTVGVTQASWEVTIEVGVAIGKWPG